MNYQLTKTIDCDNNECAMNKHSIGTAVDYYDAGGNITDLNIAFRLMAQYNKNEKDWCACKVDVEVAS